MMKPQLIILFFCSLWLSSQTKEELDNVMLSKDELQIVYFIKKYPNNPNVPFLKKKLSNVKSNNVSKAIENLALYSNRVNKSSSISSSNSISNSTSSSNIASNSSSSSRYNYNNLNTSKNTLSTNLEKDKTIANTISAKKTEKILNHLFNNDPTNPDAFLQIQNQSDCDIKVKIEGKNVYYLDVPRMGENFVLVPKGKYNISTQMCRAQYASSKDLYKDMMIKLVGNKTARN